MEVTSTLDAERAEMTQTSGMPKMPGLAEIVVGLDASVPGQAALEWAATQARLTGQDLRVVHAIFPWGTGTYLAAGGYVPMMLPSDSIQDHQRDLISALFEAVRPEPTWTLEFVSDDPGPALVSASRTASMLVIGTREHTGWGRVLSGSVSHYCLSHSRCPVLAVPVEHRPSADAPAAVGAPSDPVPQPAVLVPSPPGGVRAAEAAAAGDRR